MGILSHIEKLRDRAEQSVLSLPALMIKSETLADNIIHGEHARKKSGTGEKFWQYREYDASDRPQDIDWRQSAKGDQVFIKQKEWQITRKVFLWCAGGPSMSFASNETAYSKQECAQILSLSLALLLKKAKEQIGIYGEERTGRSEETMAKITEFLFQRSAIDETLPDTESLSMPRHAFFIGAGDFLRPIEEIERSFIALSKQTQSALIIQVLDPTEIDLSYNGRIRFKAPNGDKEIINHVASVRQAYQERIIEHIETVRNLAESYQWHYVFHRTDNDIEVTLRQIWQILSMGEHEQ
ncbi:MAG: DUF58 domain-containing protein [Alcanivorax sp.]